MAGEFLKDRLDSIKNRIEQAKKRAGRTDNLTLLLASKTQTTERVSEAIKLGLRVFGENYIQEFEKKQKEISDVGVEWHLIGHLQSNKVKNAVGKFKLIQSVDSLDLARKINQVCQNQNLTQDVLCEVNLASEQSKSGIAVQDAESLVFSCDRFENLKLRGFMVLPPLGKSAEDSRRYFIQIRKLMEKIQKNMGSEFCELSMGTSFDFEVAIEEGATLIRLGEVFWGPRK